MSDQTNITIDDLVKLDFRIATIKSVEEVEGADRLYKLILDVGAEIGERQIVSGIRQWFQPEDLIGKQVVYLANLEPRMFKGVLSSGMLIATESADGGAVLISPQKMVDPGSSLR